ncbi:hypothetical protein [Kribbella albertanoniae]|uniref:Uncharacterized protein n=1 Tax=Kribbella albertanoniae TaxID=1266829 RepID=A0A4R4QJ02_9ACTN|nr:hypothetical protein [Kribbella albertanoniae]TDC35776.1 hypothetical protein E1261_00155 [Kribbella albertanoniae]
MTPVPGGDLLVLDLCLVLASIAFGIAFGLTGHRPSTAHELPVNCGAPSAEGGWPVLMETVVEG